MLTIDSKAEPNLFLQHRTTAAQSRDGTVDEMDQKRGSVQPSEQTRRPPRRPGDLLALRGRVPSPSSRRIEVQLQHAGSGVLEYMYLHVGSLFEKIQEVGRDASWTLVGSWARRTLSPSFSPRSERWRTCLDWPGAEFMRPPWRRA